MSNISVQWLKDFQQFLTRGSIFTKKNTTDAYRLPTWCLINTLMLQVRSNATFLPVSNVPHFTLPPKNLDRGQNLKKSKHCIVAPNALYKYAK